jgi:subtilase family protein
MPASTPDASSSPDTDLSLPFGEATGRGLRIAVIDSGVNARHPHIARVAGGVNVGSDGKIEEGSYSDFLGHGTAVMAAIQEKAPDAEYYAVKLFHGSLRTTTYCLLSAIHWAIEQHMDVVNLSLGTRNGEYAEHFKALTELAALSGTLLVSAREANGEPCFPGCLPGVFGVGLDWDCNRNRYRYETIPGGAIFYASGYPRSLPGMPRERNLHGISFAVANMSGFILRAGQFLAPEGVKRLSSDAMRQALLAEARITES